MSGQEKPNFEKIQQNRTSWNVKLAIQPKVNIFGKSLFYKTFRLWLKTKNVYLHFALQLICNPADNE